MADARALIVDDEPDIRELLELTLQRMGLATRSAKDLASARAQLADGQWDICLSDMRLPDGNGIDLARHITANYPSVPVAMITAHGSMDSAIEALKAGAFDFVSKPVDLAQLRSLVDQALKLKPMEEGGEAGANDRLIGHSPPMQQLRRQAAKLSRSQAPLYISGESGSGKEIVARLIHEQGPRASGAFVPVNCGAIPGELMESEFFGHKKGAFTGATADKDGLFQAAEGGTLFLDEVADLPPPMQVKLLRAIQEKAVRPVGSQQEVQIDVRILSATHRDLAERVTADAFRQDLYYRINVIELRVPSLRERNEDIPLFAAQTLARLGREYGMQPPGTSPEAMAALRAYDFPGNVRELDNILERAFTLCDGDRIEHKDLQFSPAGRTPITAEDETPDSTPMAESSRGADAVEAPETADTSADAEREEDRSLEDYLERIERTKIMEALEATRWNKTAAAKRLGITFRALRYRLKKLDLE